MTPLRLDQPGAAPSDAARGWRSRRLTAWLAAIVALAVVTLALLGARERLDRAYVALAYLLVVLGGSATGGRALGLFLSAAAFLLFNFLFIRPYRTLALAEPLDWLVLAAFLLTGTVAAHLLARAQAEARAAEARAAEVDRLAEVGAATLSAARAEDALAAIAKVIETTLAMGRCDILVADTSAEVRGGAARWVVEHGRALAETQDGMVHMGDGDSLAGPLGAALPSLSARAVYLPLRVRARVVGVLKLSDRRPLALDRKRLRYLEALAYYAALAVERARLAADAERVEALREADRLKDSLLASVSHDLRTPLTTIGALAHELSATGEERGLLIEEEVDRLNRMVAALLDLSRLTTGSVPTTIALNAAEDVMGAALQRVAGRGAGRDIRASLDPREPVLVGRFDFSHTLRILVNLLDNALKYAPPGTPVEFTVRRDGGRLLFLVEDAGPGVPAGERDRIFAPFYRPAGALPDAGGAGLGLAIARGLAEVQGGTLEFVPREPTGSTFILALPAAELADAAAG